MTISACSTTKIYCLENCPPGRRTKPQNLRRFQSRAAAEAGGYRACKVCRPDLYDGPWLPKAARA